MNWGKKFWKVCAASLRILFREGTRSYLRQVSEKIRRREFTILEPKVPSNSVLGSPFPIPSDFLLRQIGGPGMTPEIYLQSGCTLSHQIKQGMHVAGRDFDFKSVLDWGCGCARVLRWLCWPKTKCRFYGTDISQEAVEWCRKNIPFAKFERNNPLPPLPFPDGSFDLIYGISVLTHLDEAFQFAWLKELGRVAKPGAIIILSTHGDIFGQLFLSRLEYERLSKKGFLYTKAVEKGGVHGLPSFYQTTFHTRQYVENKWGKFFTLLLYAEHGAKHQDLIVMEKAKFDKTGMVGHPKSYVHLDLPIGHIEDPRLNTVVSTQQLSVRGWAFRPSGGTIQLDLFIDERKVGSLTVDANRSDIAQNYPTYPSANCSGFSTTIQINDLNAGIHILSISETSNSIPISCIHFQTWTESLR